MSPILSYILIYWALTIILTMIFYLYIIKHYNVEITFWKRILLLFVAPPFLPFILIAVGLFGKKKPEPVPLALLSMMKYDTVKDGNKYISLPEFNEAHSTSYTLADIYGEEYAQKYYNEEHKNDKDFKPRVPNTLLDPFQPERPSRTACETLGYALVIGLFDELASMLDDNVETILYKHSTIRGKNDVLNYWKGWKERYMDKGEIKEPKLLLSQYNDDIALSLDNMLVYTYVVDMKIKKILFMNHYISPGIGFRDDMTKKTFDLDDIKEELNPVTEEDKTNLDLSFDNRVPCLHCGEKSENLQWYLHNVEAGTVGYRSVVSVCPHCNKVVEYNSIIRYRF